MLILILRTDKPEAEVGLYDDNVKLVVIKWEAHRQLAETLHLKIKNLLEDHGKAWTDIDGIVCYKGPGSFTGLRIGLSVANALADSLSAAIVASTGEDWLDLGLSKILVGQDDRLIVPDYGAPVHITVQRK